MKHIPQRLLQSSWRVALALTVLPALPACAPVEEATDTEWQSDEAYDLQSKATCPAGSKLGANRGRLAWAVYYPWYRDRPFTDYGANDYKSAVGNRTELKKAVLNYWTSASHSKQFKDRPIGPPDLGGAGLLSYDPVAIRWQIDKAKSAAIDGFLTNYLGKDDFSHAAVRQLIKEATAKRFKIGLHVSPQGAHAHAKKKGGDATVLLADWIKQFVSAFGNESAVTKVDGKVLAIVYSTELMTPENWKSIRSRLQGVNVFLVADNGSSTKFQKYISFFDGAVGRNIPADAGLKLGEQLRKSNLSKLWMAEVRPGFDNVERGAPKNDKYESRNSGKLFQQTFDAALRVDPQWLRIVSWNEYYEHTHIEPSDVFKETYLDAAEARIQHWKACK